MDVSEAGRSFYRCLGLSLNLGMPGRNVGADVAFKLIEKWARGHPYI